MAKHGKNGYTKAKTDTETDAETDTDSSPATFASLR
jgi:hypothetical protein